MKNHAFTLIELLVVVLIIGILSAIALPQYQVAVGKAKYTQLMVNGNALATATQSYRLATNQWPTDWDSLDISLPVNQGCSKWVTNANTSRETFVIYCNNGTNRYRVHMAVNGTKSQRCECDENSILGNRICKSVIGKQMPDSNYNGVNLYNF